MNKSPIPNILSFINLGLGVISIMLCTEGMMLASGLCILAAALMDRYDGRIARMLNVESPLGKELDSLADLVSFGVAPALLSWKLSLPGLGVIGYVILLAFPICGAYRLARFNVTQFKNVYTGIPITAAGVLLALDSISVTQLGSHAGLTAIFMALLSYLMVSSVRVKKI